VRVELASEFRYRRPVVDADTLVVVISQSGETADTIASLEEGKRLGARTLAVCNVVESSIPRQADATIYTHAGPEIGVASTKAFLTQLEVLYFVALKLAMLRGRLPAEELARRVQALLKLPDQMRAVLECRPRVQEIADKIYKKENCYFLGRGLEFPVALEGALKLKEISYVHAEGYAGGEMKHGPIALIEEDVPVVAIAVHDGLYEKMASNVEEICARGAAVYGIIPEGDTELAAKCRLTIALPETHPDLAPFLTILPLQLLAYEVADLKGTDVDQPRNLAKSVTVE
jgi:glucosamine--fructose-6-phosphate aminotransferase (isomerizing)